MYTNAAAVFRGDIAGVLEQAKDWENGLVGTRVMPILPVPVRAGQYPSFLLKEGQLLKNEIKNRTPNSAYARATQAYNQETYTALEYGIEMGVDDTVAQDVSRFFDAEVVAAKLAQRKLLLGHELRVAAKIFDTSTFTATNSGTAYTTANLATFDVGADVQEAIDRLLAKGEGTSNLRVVMSSPVWTRIRASTKFQNRLRGAGLSSDTILNASTQAAAEVFGVSEVLIGRASYDSAPEGIAFSSSNVWSNAYIWVGSVTEASTGFFGGGAGFTLNWSEYGPAVGVFTYRDESIKSNIVRASQYTAEKVVNANAGQIINTQYA
jgi:transposase